MTKGVVFTACDTPNDIKDLWKKVKDEWKEQFALYENCNNVGLVFVFITDGYKGVLSRQKNSWRNLNKERLMRTILEDSIAETGAKKIQIVGVKELIPTMSGLETAADKDKTSLASLLLAGEQHLYYDSPKLIEAIIRIARGFHFGNELIFRMDADVKPNDKGFHKLIEYYDTNLKSKGERYYFFSGHYFDSNQQDLINDFAVRTHFFSPAGTKSFIKNDHETVKYKQGYDAALKWLQSLNKVGADPFDQVISGAGLCISQSAIEVLPPFANMNELIVWIDDHLKRLLHEQLGHLPKPGSTSYSENQHVCKDATFKQNRYPDGVEADDITNACSKYFPRLVRGCLMDALIPSYYGDYVTRLVKESEKVSLDTLKKKLQEPANDRLQQIIRYWGDQDYDQFHVSNFTRTELASKGQDYISQVIEDLARYLDLLDEWPRFVSLSKYIPASERDNAWLFRSPL